MSDPIDRQAAITAICEDGTWLERQGCTEITMCERKQRDADILSELPPVDAVEVVRCKDCKYWPYKTITYWDNQIEFETYQWCASLGLHGGKGFCSKGERRTDADNRC